MSEINLRTVLSEATHRLQGSGTDTPRLDAEVLLFHVTGMNRTQLYCALDDQVDDQTVSRLDEVIQRRIKGEPVSYLVGNKEFMGLGFHVDRRVLVPRPETELLVEKSMEILGRRLRRGQGISAVDVGTGSGAIVVSLAHQFPQLRFFATDASADALEVARLNAERHGVAERITFLKGNLLEPLEQVVDVIISNPPYTKLVELPAGILDYEPHEALDGGPDGLACLQELLSQAESRLKPGGAVLLEMDPRQRFPVTSFAQSRFPKSNISVWKDYSGADRVVLVDCSAVDRESASFHRLRG